MSTTLLHSISKVSLVLAAGLVFLVPFADASRNIDLQGGVLIFSGICAWVGLLLSQRRPHSKIITVALLVFIASCVLSLLLNPHVGYDLFGAPYLRLGTAGLLACIGVGSLVSGLKPRHLSVVLYGLIGAVSLVSLPYSWWRFGYVMRLPGLVAQTDVLACLLGAGLLLGLELLPRYPQHRIWLALAQGYMAVLLLLTETRAVLFLVVILGLIWSWQHKPRLKVMYPLIMAALILTVVVTQTISGRVTDRGYAAQSVRYRLTLQHYALKASEHKPLWGYGPGNLADALACSNLPAPDLQSTCRQGYFFNSSHNIFVDRVLGVGWVGGLAYLTVVSTALYQGLREPKSRPFAYALLLIAGYYLTNVTGVVVELLLWVLVFQCLKPSRA